MLWCKERLYGWLFNRGFLWAYTVRFEKRGKRANVTGWGFTLKRIKTTEEE